MFLETPVYWYSHGVKSKQKYSVRLFLRYTKKPGHVTLVGPYPDPTKTGA